jgi:phosphate:Na+ symporter
MTLQLIGGAGIFLLGMILLTDGLKDVAGDTLRNVLGRLTGRTLPALLTGATVTALLQSSTATVLMTIGFVSAGLIAFPGAVAVVFGANVGTTSTGWIVALLGLKLSIGTAALPAVAAGALLRMLTSGRLAGAGMALAGFGLIFLGIDLLQLGMQGLAQRIDPAALPGGTVWGRLLLVVVGIVMTVAMQSSSAAVATTLTALHSGAIGVEQAAALVVGQNIGTTVTAAVAAAGASVAARRTALAHILFNVFTGVLAFSLIPALLAMEARLWPGDGTPDPELLVAGFHTVFNLIGVVILLPFARPFGRLVERAIPDRGPAFTRHLDASVASVPGVAPEAARRAVLLVLDALLGLLRNALEYGPPRKVDAHTLERADDALAETRRFIDTASMGDGGADPARYVAVLHAVDHLDRLVERLRDAPSHGAAASDYRAEAVRAASEIERARMWLAGVEVDVVDTWRVLAAGIADRRRVQRSETLAAAAAGRLSADTALTRLEAMRWLDSSVYHVWRAVHHLQTSGVDTQVEMHD